MALGLRTKQVASQLGIEYGTAKVHLANIYIKLEISSKTALTRAWIIHELANDNLLAIGGKRD